jgi:hypothetical protein
MNAATLSAQQARKLPGDLPAELRAIDAMTTGELRAKYAELFGHATATRNRTYLRRKIQYRSRNSPWVGCPTARSPVPPPSPRSAACTTDTSARAERALPSRRARP